MKKLWTVIALTGLTACVAQEGDQPTGPRVVATSTKELLGDVRIAGDLEQLGDGSSWPANFVAYMSGGFFTASVSREEGGTSVFTGTELFYTDGTDITLVRDICAGPCDSTPQMLTASSTSIYFTAFTPNHGRELWEATPNGAWLVTDFTPGSSGTDIRELTDFIGMAYFTAPLPGTLSRGLYRAHGSWTERVGTVELPRNLAVVDGYLYFAGHSPGYGMELWRTDGTEAGTVRLTDINPGSGSSLPRSIVGFNGNVWFIASDGTTGDELWYLTGTTPVRHADMIPGPESPFPMDVAPQLTVVDSTLFFVAKIDEKAARLWRVVDDFGWPLPPEPVDGACTGPICPVPTNPGQLTSAGTMLYFSAEDATFGRHLWSAPGDYSGLASKVVRQFSGGAINSSASSDPSHFVAVGSALYMTAKDGTAPAGENQRMWLVDHRGARVVGNVPNPASPPNPYPLGFMRSTGELFFSAANDLGQEPWWLDARRAVSVTDVTAVTSNVVSMDGLAFFGGADQTGEVELWTFDGQILNRIDINPTGSSDPQNFHVVLSPSGNWVYFGASVASAQLWRSNGTVTERVTGIDDNATGGFHVEQLISFLHPPGPKPPVELVFSGWHSTEGYQVYSSAGTLGSEVLLTTGLTSARHLTKVGARAYFLGETFPRGDEVYYYDPAETLSATNPRMIGEIVVGPTGGSITEMVNHNGYLYFVADKGPGPQIFRSVNGSPPAQVTNVSGGLWPENLKSILVGWNYQLYFRGVNGSNRVFRLTATSSTLTSLSTCQDASGFTLYKTQVYFACRGVGAHDASGLELWRTNSSGISPQRFIDINKQGDSEPRFLGEANGRMYISARDDFAGREPWWFNQSGTFDSQHDINPGPPDSDPEDLVQVTHGWVLKALDANYATRLYFADNL